MRERVRPWMEVRGPDGVASRVDLGDDGLRVGRDPSCTDLQLGPDPDRWVSRLHCRVERQPGGWAIVDQGSRNGTRVRRGGELFDVPARLTMVSGDTVLILARTDHDGRPVYWELAFHDPEVTVPAPAAQGRARCLQYDEAQGRLFLVDGAARTEVTGLRPQEHRLIRHLAGRNREGGGAPVLCSHDELVIAVWGEDAAVPHTREELARLVYEVRRRVESDLTVPGSIETVRGFGYRLVTCQGPASSL